MGGNPSSYGYSCDPLYAEMLARLQSGVGGSHMHAPSGLSPGHSRSTPVSAKLMPTALGCMRVVSLHLSCKSLPIPDPCFGLGGLTLPTRIDSWGLITTHWLWLANSPTSHPRGQSTRKPPTLLQVLSLLRSGRKVVTDSLSTHGISGASLSPTMTRQRHRVDAPTSLWGLFTVAWRQQVGYPS